jgi:GDP-4-dehydro-6-deoxy-D-mannose reductase
VIRVLVTGATGFVGQHLIGELPRQLPEGARIVATGFDPRIGADAAGAVQMLDVTDATAVAEAIGAVRPTHVIHLSGISAPSEAGVDPRRAWEINTLGTLAVADGILRRAPNCCLIFAGTGLVYGAAADAGHRFSEISPLAPTSDYAVTKAAADLLIGAMATRGLRSVRLRLFNHTGPGQTEAFVVPRLAAQIARVEAGLQPPQLRVGNLEGVRDFLHVRDVVTAYALAVTRSPALSPDTILNIASGEGYRIRTILQQLLELSPAGPSIAISAAMTEGPPDISVGDPTLAERLLEWRPRYELRETLESVLAFWRARVAEAPDQSRPG